MQVSLALNQVNLGFRLVEARHRTRWTHAFTWL